MKELQWEAGYIYITQKKLSPNFEWGFSPPFDQQMTLSLRNLSPNIRCGGVSTLEQITCSFQEVSPPRQGHLVLMRCYLLTIQVGNETIIMRSRLYIHNSKKPTFQIWMGGLSPPFDQQVTLSSKILSPSFGWGLSLTFYQLVTLSPKILNPSFGWGVISAFCSANDTQTKKFKSQLWMGDVSALWSASDTESKKPDTVSKNPKSQH